MPTWLSRSVILKKEKKLTNVNEILYRHLRKEKVLPGTFIKKKESVRRLGRNRIDDLCHLTKTNKRQRFENKGKRS